MIGQVKECEARIKANEETFYKCLWSDCKVYNMASSSRSWLEKHVPVHGGKYPFGCIVSGCKKRFSTQVRQKKLAIYLHGFVLLTKGGAKRIY